MKNPEQTQLKQVLQDMHKYSGNYIQTVTEFEVTNNPIKKIESYDH